MTYQLPPLDDEYQFEMLVRDILRRVYDDPGIERFGRRGQTQHGIDGLSPADLGITFQCKLKDIRYGDEAQVRKTLLADMEADAGKTKGLSHQPRLFIFATTYKNDAHLQQKAAALSGDSMTVEYWGWDTVSEKIWEHAESLIPVYYPSYPVRRVPGFTQVSPGGITRAETKDAGELDRLATEYYRINDRSEVVFRVVCNDIDVRNDSVMDEVYERLRDLPTGGTLWILGDGGSGKTTILHRLSVELARRGHNIYTLDLETHPSREDLESILSLLKFGQQPGQTVLCIDNPAADDVTLEALLHQLPDYCPGIHVLLAERAHRYRALRRAGCLTYLHGEEDENSVFVRNTRRQRRNVYGRLFGLLGLSDADVESVQDIALNERLVYVNATYSILLELKRKRKIDFDFDWDDYANSTSGLPAFSNGYKYIALFYLFGVRTPFAVLSKISGADEAQQKAFLERFRGLVNEPVIVEERRDETFRKSVHVRTKHEIISEIFFREHPDLDKDELLMEWCEHTDFENIIEAQALINILGVKKNFAADNAHADLRGLTDFLLRGYLREKVAASPKLNATLHLAKFWSLQLQGKPDDAIRLLESFLADVPEDFHCRTELAKLYQRQNRLADAEAVLQKILDLRPDDLNSRTELAKIYQRQGRLADAEAILLRLLELDDRNIRAYTELAKVHQRQNRLAEAEAALATVLAIKANDLQARTELAKIYQRQGKLIEAEELLRKILDIKPNDLNSRTELAKIYQRQNKLPEAEVVLLGLLNIDVNNLQARTELAKIYQRQGRFDEAERRAEEVLGIDPLNDHAMCELLGVWKRQGEREKCARRFLAFIEQPGYRFSRYSQAPVFRFFHCCKAFNMKEPADLVFRRFGAGLDEQNREFYLSNFDVG